MLGKDDSGKAASDSGVGRQLMAILLLGVLHTTKHPSEIPLRIFEMKLDIESTWRGPLEKIAKMGEFGMEKRLALLDWLVRNQGEESLEKTLNEAIEHAEESHQGLEVSKEGKLLFVERKSKAEPDIDHSVVEAKNKDDSNQGKDQEGQGKKKQQGPEPESGLELEGKTSEKKKPVESSVASVIL